MPSPTIGGGSISFNGRPAVIRPSVRTVLTWRDISVFNGRISTKLDKNIHHVSGHCCTGFQGQRSRSRSNQLSYIGGSIHFQQCGVEAHLLDFAPVELIHKILATISPCSSVTNKSYVMPTD